MTAMVIDYLSPSKIHFVNECKLRYVLTLADKSSNGSKLFNKNTFLGILMHSVLEHYLKRKCFSQDYESLWDELLKKMIFEYGIDIQDIDIIKYHLPFYNVKKNKLKQLLKTINYDIPEFNLSLEKRITGGTVSGTADIILDNPAKKKVKIIDFKTGPFVSYENAEKQEVKYGYLLQLKTYGYVYWLKGYLPENICCVLQGVSESEYEEIVFSREEYKIHEEFLTGLKKVINQAIDEGKQNSLASPSPEACKYCEHSFTCNALHVSMTEENNFHSFSFIRQINSEFDDEEFKINLITSGGKVSIQKIPNRTYILIKQSIKNGNSVFISGLYEEEYVNIKYWTRYTQYSEL